MTGLRSVSDDQLAAVASITDRDDWQDSCGLEPLLVAAHAAGFLSEVWIYQLLDESQRGIDLCLISVEVAPAIYVHAMPLDWRDLRPSQQTSGVEAVRHVVDRIAVTAAEVRARFFGEIAEIVSGVVMPGEDGAETSA
jgi:hypothetical protein